MSEQVPVFIKKEKIPTAKEWAEAIKSEGFGLEIDETWEEEKRCDGSYGYRPCRYYEVKDVGFELDFIMRDENPDYFQEYEELDSNVKKFDLAVCFGVYTEEDAMASAIAGTVLMKIVGEGVCFDLDDPISLESALVLCREVDREMKLKR